MGQDHPVSIADLHFLIAEDEEFQCQWLHTMLTELGARHIVEVGNGQAAHGSGRAAAEREVVKPILQPPVDPAAASR